MLISTVCQVQSIGSVWTTATTITKTKSCQSVSGLFVVSVTMPLIWKRRLLRMCTEGNFTCCFFGKLLGISYRDHITNEEVKARIGNAIGPYEDFLTSVKRRKLKWYGHVTRSSGLAKTILQGTVQGGRRRGKQRKRWEDNINEWTVLEWNSILRKAENLEEWRKLVVKSTVVPQWSARLRDR